VDRFLEDRKEFESIGKMALSAVLHRYEFKEPLFINSEEDWYGYLLNGLLLKGSPPDRLPDNNISFITFNYDRSLEQFLYTTMKNRSKMADDIVADILKKLKIIHVYGQLGDIVYSGEGPYFSYDLQQSMSKIRIMTEERAGESPELQEAKALIEQAQLVYFLGFGYDEVNLNRLGFDGKNKIKADIYGTAFNVRDRELMTAIRLIFPEVADKNLDDPQVKEIANGNFDRKAGIAKFLQDRLELE